MTDPNSGPQCNRALQDLVNHIGRLIGFDVEFGRYQGVQGENGFDGIWRTDKLAIVVEVKTSDVYAIKTAILTGYIDRLISDQRVASWDEALGLYVFGRSDAELNQMGNAIIAERRTQQLRVSTLESILSLAELVQEGYIAKEEAITLLRPASASVDDIVVLMARVASKALTGAETIAPPIIPDVAVAPAKPDEVSPSEAASTPRLHLLTPVSDDEFATAESTIRTLLGAGWYVFGDRTPGRKSLKPGDRLCFYQSGVGIVAEAEVESSPERKPLKEARKGDKFPWRFRVTKQRYFFDKPIVLNANLRGELEAFAGKNPASPWAWFVQGTHLVTEHDFQALIGQR